MIEVREALTILRSCPFPFTTESIPLSKATGRILMEELQADRDFPPFDRVSMDGIAISHERWANGQRSFPVVAVAGAGSPQHELRKIEGCVEIMTGAMLPINTDTVVRYEDLRIIDGVAEVMIDHIERGKNVHTQGSDRKAQESILKAPRVISPAEIGIAATVGKSVLRVAKMPKTMVISTGDELVPVDQVPLPHQIRSSNIHTIMSALKGLGVNVAVDHLLDNKQKVEEKLSMHLDEFQVLIIIGGSSKGKYDYVPATLEKLGVAQKFYRVKQRPGKPFWFGVRDGKQFVFALPGNPVSSFMCTERYIKEWLKYSLGMNEEWPQAVLMQDFSFPPDLTYYLQVRLQYQEGSVNAFPAVGGGSGDLANLGEADAFLELPGGRSQFKAGEVFPLLVYR